MCFTFHLSFINKINNFHVKFRFELKLCKKNYVQINIVLNVRFRSIKSKFIDQLTRKEDWINQLNVKADNSSGFSETINVL